MARPKVTDIARGEGGTTERGEGFSLPMVQPSSAASRRDKLLIVYAAKFPYLKLA